MYSKNNEITVRKIKISDMKRPGSEMHFENRERRPIVEFERKMQ